MGNLKILASHSDVKEIESICPFEEGELESLAIDYATLSNQEVAKKYRSVLFRQSGIVEHAQEFSIQLNFCDNPFCGHYGKEQKRFVDIKNKPSRYKLAGSIKSGKQLRCNDTIGPDFTDIGLDCSIEPISNWAVAEEVKRLKVINAIADRKQEYVFHRDNCEHSTLNPFSDPASFYRRGKSSSNSQKYQCKHCKKITNVLPSSRENHTYRQKKNALLPMLAKLLVARTPVKRTCETLGIAPETYYHKLELLYLKCLQFLDKHETTPLMNMDFKEVWINTDKMHYYLNNIRRKGKATASYIDLDESKFPTYLVTSAEVFSRYVFRSDIAYDYTITLDDVDQHTKSHYDDHLYPFARKHAHLRMQYAPQPPTKRDAQSHIEYTQERLAFTKREDYIEGMHTNSTYTTIAHCILLKNILGASKYVFVSDDDSSIQTSILRVFKDEVRAKRGNYFISKADKSLDNKERYSLFLDAQKEVNYFRRTFGDMSSKDAQIGLLLTELESHVFHEEFIKHGQTYFKRSKNFIEHPLPSINEGSRLLDCVTPVDHLSPQELAELLVNVNNHAVDAFYNKVRRSISILERPLVTATSSGKSYIYANYNPKYAQYAVTILRTFYNFCWPIKTYGGSPQTPAQRLGLSSKVYSYEDVIYCD